MATTHKHIYSLLILLIMQTKELKITLPVGYEIDESISTFSHIIFKKTELPITSKKSNFNVNDIVKVFDGSCNEDKNNGLKRHGIDKLFKNNSAKVIKNNLCIFNQNHEQAIFLDLKNNITFYFDLILQFPNGEKVYCSSQMCRLVIARSNNCFYDVIPKSI